MAWINPMDFVANVVLTAAQLNTHLRDNLLYLKEKMGKGVAVELTLDAAGLVTVTQAYHKIDTLADADTGNLVTIAGVSEGDIIVLRAENDARTVVLKTTGNLVLGGDISLDDTSKHVALICSAGHLHLLFTARDVTFTANAFQYPNPTVEWGPHSLGAHLPVAQTGTVVYLPLNFLKIGDVIISYNLTGDMIRTGASTLTCQLVRVDLGPIGTTNITNGAITPLAVDGEFDETANPDDETVTTDKMYYLLITGTTDAADEIYVMGAEVLVRRLV